VDRNTVVLFTRYGLGDGPEDLQRTLAVKFLTLTLESGQLPARILCYTAGVRLACTGSPVLDQLKELTARGVELVLCKTCLDTYNLAGEVQVGIVGGMGDILVSLQQAGKVISL